MSRARGVEILLRDLVREALGLEEWRILSEDPEQKEKDGTSSDPGPTDPNVSDLTIDLIKNPTAAKAKAKQALKTNGGHFEPAGDDLDMSGRQLRRWMYKNIGKADTLKIAAEPGPDDEFDPKTGDAVTGKDNKDNPRGQGFLAGRDLGRDERGQKRGGEKAEKMK